MRCGSGAALLLFAVGSAAGFAGEPGTFVWTQKNQAFIRVYRETSRDESRQAPDFRGRTENKLDIPAAQVGLVLNGEVRSVPSGVQDEYEIEFVLREACAQIRRNAHCVAFGNQVVTWGKLDDLAILDIVNPQDYRWFVLLDKPDRKDRVAMLRYNYDPNDLFRVELLLLPVFQPARLDFFDSNWSLFGGMKDDVAASAAPESIRRAVRNLRVEEDPSVADGGIETAEAALRLRGTLGNVDYGAYYMNLHNRVPSLRARTPMGNAVKRALFDQGPSTLAPLLSATLTPEDLILEEVYERGNVVGLDFETVLGEFGVRGEVGYFTDQPFLKADDFSCTTRNSLSLGVGIDRTQANDFYWNLQVVGDFVPGADGELFATETFAQQVAVNLRKDLFMGHLCLSVSGIWRISYADGMIHPEVRYRYSDAIELAFGGFRFEGDDPFDLYGRFDDNDLFYTEARCRF